jgi:hypothetical protein
MAIQCSLYIALFFLEAIMGSYHFNGDSNVGIKRSFETFRETQDLFKREEGNTLFGNSFVTFRFRSTLVIEVLPGT